MANPELGAKQVCPNCQSKFYDLNRRPAVCPKCDTSFDPEEVVRSRRLRPRGAGPDYEADEEVKPKPAEEDAEDHADAPEVDEAAEVGTLDADEEDENDRDKVEPDADLGADFEEEGADLESESEDVPFLVEEEDGDFGEDAIEPHPGEEEG